MTELIITYATAIIAKAGYVGVFILMVLESMVAPVPSEAVMPFAGFLWFQKIFTPWGVIGASTAGSLVGSLISYWIGAKGGRVIIERYGKYFLLNTHHLAVTEQFFARYGNGTVFVSRFIPVVRHLISIPAGVGKMPLGKFCVYTIVGAGLWNGFLTWVGYALGQNWQSVERYGHSIDIAIVVAIILVCLFFIYRTYRARPYGSHEKGY
ncbi:DedA family protein [Candidatus Uhrbacteria bacterium]|nr:DedA family protein [Candidatus Uhrbacteria bacterium]